MRRYWRKGGVIILLVMLLLALSVSAAAASGGATHHTVRPGETLFSIGRLYGVNPYSIAAVNHLPNPDCIYAGQVLWIPSYDQYYPSRDCDYGWSGCGGYNNYYNNNYYQSGCNYGNCCGYGYCGGYPRYGYGNDGYWNPRPVPYDDGNGGYWQNPRPVPYDDGQMDN